MIYMDNGATTEMLPEVMQAMQPYLHEQYGNPSGVYEFAGNAKMAVESAREQIADSLGVLPAEIYFTGGGTESDNWAIKGVAAMHPEGGHIITSKIEHHAVLHTCMFLEKQGYQVTYLDVDENGMVSPEQVEKAIRDNTILISIMFANNEIGTLQPIAQIGKIAKQHNILFHTDAVQAYMHVPFQVPPMGISLLSASSHKFHGPKGVGFLYIREGVAIENLLHGGGQEKRRRSGTENVAGIVGMGKAVELGMQNRSQEIGYVKRLRTYMIERLFREIPYLRLNGDLENRLPGNINISFQFVEGQSLLVLLDMEGICASVGSACSSGDKQISHVLSSIGLHEDLARGTVRFTLSAGNTKEEIDTVVERLKGIVADLREFSDDYQRLKTSTTS